MGNQIDKLKKVEVFILGSKGIPAKYGGFETFVENLTSKKNNDGINYNISCISNQNSEFYYNNSRCFNVKVPNIGPGKAIVYDILALKKTIDFIKKQHIDNFIVYILASRIGPFLNHYKKQIHKLNGKVLLNPDGNEWKRKKWNFLIRRYWKISEKQMVSKSDLIVCDSMQIQKYIKSSYTIFNPITKYIPYGSDLTQDKLTINDSIQKWYDTHKIRLNEYYLIVGRFVEENNYEYMIREFLKSDTNKDLVIITNVEKNKFYRKLNNKLNFKKDSRIKFVGTIYDYHTINFIRENAYAYLHGHEVGGTNPSLLESLSKTKINILLDVNFNREVGKNSCFYFDKMDNSLIEVIRHVETLSAKDIIKLEKESKTNIHENYNWTAVVNSYEKLFIELNQSNSVRK